jgi:hypothetical protein
MLLLGLPATDPTADVTDLEAGQPFAVAARRRDGHRWRNGTLTLDTQALHVLVWHSHWPRATTTQRHPLTPPIDVESVQKTAGSYPDQFRKINLHADGHPWILQIPTVDVPLVRVPSPTRTPTQLVV